jgi:hypothetical protein
MFSIWFVQDTYFHILKEEKRLNFLNKPKANLLNKNQVHTTKKAKGNLNMKRRHKREGNKAK